jgi:hypothetical protein
MGAIPPNLARGHGPLLQNIAQATCRSAPWARFRLTLLAGMARSYRWLDQCLVGAGHARDMACPRPKPPAIPAVPCQPSYPPLITAI